MNAENESKPTEETTQPEATPPPVIVFDDLVDRLFNAVTERFNDGLNASIEEAKRAFAAEASADAEAKVKEIAKAAETMREEGSRRLAAMQAEFKTELNRAKERVDTEITKALQDMTTTGDRYKRHLEAAATQIAGFGKRLDTGLAEVPALRKEVAELRAELAATKINIDAARKDSTDSKNLATTFKGDLVTLKGAFGSLRKFVDIIADKTGVRKGYDSADPA